MYRKVPEYGMYIALAMILSYIEVLIPINFGIQGVKLGLANLVVFILLYTEGIMGAAMVSILRILLVSFSFGNAYSLLYSLTGGILSLVIMILCKKTKLFSKIGVSMMGGVSHNIGQVFIASLVLGNAAFYYLPALLVAGLITGGVNGLLGKRILMHLNNLA